MSSHSLQACMVSTGCPLTDELELFICYASFFPAFMLLFLLLTFENLIIVCLGMVLLGFNLFGNLWPSCAWIFIFL